MSKQVDTRENLAYPGRHRALSLMHGPVLHSVEVDQTAGWVPGERLDHLFEGQCDLLRKTGKGMHLAVDMGAVRLTYDQLDAKANQLARYLIAQGCNPGDRIALLFDDPVRSLVGMLAVLKIHAAYVPLDAGYPAGSPTSSPMPMSPRS